MLKNEVIPRDQRGHMQKKTAYGSMCDLEGGNSVTTFGYYPSLVTGKLLIYISEMLNICNIKH